MIEDLPLACINEHIKPKQTKKITKKKVKSTKRESVKKRNARLEAESVEYNKRTSYYRDSDMARYKAACVAFEKEKVTRIPDEFGNYGPWMPPDWFSFVSLPPTTAQWEEMSKEERDNPGSVIVVPMRD